MNSGCFFKTVYTGTLGIRDYFMLEEPPWTANIVYCFTLLLRHVAVAAATSIAHPLFNFDHHKNYCRNTHDAQPRLTAQRRGVKKCVHQRHISEQQLRRDHGQHAADEPGVGKQTDGEERMSQ